MTRVGIIGASGYTGHELFRILKAYPEVKIKVLNSRSFVGKKVSEVYPDFTGDDSYTGYSLVDVNAMKLDLVFLALPHSLSMDAIQQLDGHAKIIDLSADYRFKDPKQYAKIYGREPLKTDYNWVYGLPELFKDQIKTAHAVANPGCYATASILATYPVQDLAERIILDCKSGWSGAGRESAYAKDPTIIQDNLVAYKLTRHRHKYEVEQFIKPPLSFTPHVFNTFQGMMCTAHIILKGSADSGQIAQLYKDFYKDATFVRVKDATPQVHDTQKTNYCDIGGFEIDATNQLVVVSTIDNLWKGAAGQAVQNMNLMLGFPETAGLLTEGLA